MGVVIIDILLTTMKFLSFSFRRHDYFSLFSPPLNCCLERNERAISRERGERIDVYHRGKIPFTISFPFKLAFDGSIKVCTIMMDRYGPYRFDTSILRIHTPARLRALLHSSFLAEYRVTKTLFDNGDLRARESRTNERQVW